MPARKAPNWPPRLKTRRPALPLHVGDSRATDLVCATARPRRGRRPPSPSRHTIGHEGRVAALRRTNRGSSCHPRLSSWGCGQPPYPPLRTILDRAARLQRRRGRITSRATSSTVRPFEGVSLFLSAPRYRLRSVRIGGGDRLRWRDGSGKARPEPCGSGEGVAGRRLCLPKSRVVRYTSSPPSCGSPRTRDLRRHGEPPPRPRAIPKPAERAYSRFAKTLVAVGDGGGLRSPPRPRNRDRGPRPIPIPEDVSAGLPCRSSTADAPPHHGPGRALREGARRLGRSSRSTGTDAEGVGRPAPRFRAGKLPRRCGPAAHPAPDLAEGARRGSARPFWPP